MKVPGSANECVCELSLCACVRMSVPRVASSRLTVLSELHCAPCTIYRHSVNVRGSASGAERETKGTSGILFFPLSYFTAIHASIVLSARLLSPLGSSAGVGTERERERERERGGGAQADKRSREISNLFSSLSLSLSPFLSLSFLLSYTHILSLPLSFSHSHTHTHSLYKPSFKLFW